MTDKNASPQAQAGHLHLKSPFEDENGNDISGEYITLKAHREAMDHVKAHAEYQRKSLADWVQELITSIAKKDAALKFYADNLFRRKSNGEPCIQTAIEHDCGDRARAAITQSQGSLNDMG